MTNRYLYFIVMMLISFFGLSQQRVVAECTVEYKAMIDSTISSDENTALKNSTKVVYIKGNNARIDLISTSFLQSVIYDKSNETVTVLREFGNNKVLTKLSKTEWQERNKKYEAFALENTKETKTILGYSCNKAYLKTKDGNQILVYYTTTIVPSIKEFEYQFKDVPGFVLAYEINEGNNKIYYVASKINLSPVQTSKFVIPTKGYRILQ